MTAAQQPGSDALAQQFVQFAVDAGVLRFGEFKTKAGRLSPYFFNAGGFDDGAKLARGCTSGQALSGGALLSVGSWIFIASCFAAGYALAPIARRLWR